MAGPLAGVHVLDLARVLAGPYAAMLLGDLGAEVIKVERPGQGDDTRHWGPPFVSAAGSEVAGGEVAGGEAAGDRGESTYFLSVNRGKRSVAIDLKDPAEREFVEALVRWADVLIENFRPGVMDRLGLADDRLADLNPRLIRLSISGFGERGPDRDRVGYDQILQAEGGVMSLTGTAPGRAVKVGVPIADISAALFGVIGVLGALVDREHSGLGQRVSTSLLAGQVGIHTFQATRYLIAGQVPGVSGNHHPTVAPYGVFDAADGPLVIAVGNDDIWRRFAPLAGLDPADPRFATNALRLAHLAELQELMNAAFGQRRVADWLDRLRRAGVPAGELKTLDRVYESEQARAEDLVWEVDHPRLRHPAARPSGALQPKHGRARAAAPWPGRAYRGVARRPAPPRAGRWRLTGPRRLHRAGRAHARFTPRSPIPVAWRVSATTSRPPTRATGRATRTCSSGPGTPPAPGTLSPPGRRPSAARPACSSGSTSGSSAARWERPRAPGSPGPSRRRWRSASRSSASRPREGPGCRREPAPCCRCRRWPRPSRERGERASRTSRSRVTRPPAACGPLSSPERTC